MNKSGWIFGLILIVVFTTLAACAAAQVVDITLSQATPNRVNATHNPRLGINVVDSNNHSVTVIFETNTSGVWKEIGRSTGNNGMYYQMTSGFEQKNTTFYWRAQVTDGSSTVNDTYSFMAQPFVLKWTYFANASTMLSPLAEDVNHDGIYEVFTTGKGAISALNGTNGKLLWKYYNGNFSTNHVAFEIHDLDNDGIPELVAAAGYRTIALHANNGSVYWDVPVESDEKYIVIVDTDGNHYPYVYTTSTDIMHGENGTGRLRKLNGTNGKVLKETFAWRPCWGGLSAADADNDGTFEIYMGDRKANYTPGELGQGMQAYDADNLSLIWKNDKITDSSNLIALVDVNKDNILDAVALQQSGGGVCVMDSATKQPMPGKCVDSLGLGPHSPFAIYDIDGDGNLEMTVSYHSIAKVWDLGRMDVDARLATFDEPPKMADVMGDSRLEIIGGGSNIIIYNSSYQLVENITGANSIDSTIVQDIDNDGQNELIAISGSGYVRVFDTGAFAPTPRVRTNAQYYSEMRQGAGVYVPPIGAPQPILKEEFPLNGSVDASSNPRLTIHAIDFRYDKMDITFSLLMNGIWTDIATFTGVENGVYNATSADLGDAGTTYTWRVTASDPAGDRLTTTKVFSFTTPEDAAWPSGWEFRRALNVSSAKVAATIDGFPVLVDMYDGGLQSYAQANGQDIFFALPDGTKVNHELESYSDGHLVAWVKLNVSTARDTMFYMYYGNPSAGAQESPSAVWDSRFLAVNHMSDTGSVIDVDDSTSYSNDGTPLNGATMGAQGKIDGAIQMDGIDDRVAMPRIFTNQTSFTFEGWFNSNNKQGYAISQRDTGSLGAFLQYYPGGYQLYVNGRSLVYASTANEWHYVVGTYDGTTARLYIDGQGPKTVSANITWPNLGTLYGDRSAGQRAFSGRMDEVRISDVARDSGYIRTSYNNQNSPATFITFGELIARN